jgi:hypothetical protein
MSYYSHIVNIEVYDAAMRATLPFSANALFCLRQDYYH